MDLKRKETLKNILIATRSQPVVGYIRKFLSICSLKEINVCHLFRCVWSVARSYHTDIIKASVGFIKGELA